MLYSSIFYHATAAFEMPFAVEYLKSKKPASWEDFPFISTFVSAEKSSLIDSNTEASFEASLVCTSRGLG